MADANGLVTVEWKGYCSALLRGIWKILTDQLFVDVSLSCHQHSLKVHRMILAVFFQGIKDSLVDTTGDALSDAGVKELCLDQLATDEHGADVLRYLIEFAYSGKMAVPENRLGNVLVAAEVVGFKGLAQSIRDKLKKRGVADLRKASGLMGASASGGDVKPGPASASGGGRASASAMPKKSKRKGIPMKLVTTPRHLGKNDFAVVVDNCSDVAVVSDLASTKCKTPPVALARPTHLQLWNRNDQIVRSDEDSCGFGDAIDPMSCASSSEEENESRGSDPAATIQKHLQQALRLKNVMPRADSGPGGKKPRQRASGSDLASKLPRVRDEKPLKCEECDFATASKVNLLAHYVKHERPVSAKSLDCQRQQRPDVASGNSSSSSSSSVDDAVGHNPDMQYPCKFCSFATNHKWSLRQHLAVKHLRDEDGNPITKQFQCPECEYECVTKRQLGAHTLLKHTKDRLKCDFCDYVSPRIHRIREHMAVIHGSDGKGNTIGKSIKCTECDYTCFTKNQMTEHMVYHNPESQHQCKLCPFVTSHMWSLRHHLAVKHLLDEDGNPVTKTFQCPECEYECVTKRQLLAHAVLKHPKNPFKCDFCEYVNPRKYRINEHMAVVHGSDGKGNFIGKTLKCPQCEYSCFTKKQMTDHSLRKHSSEKRYSCEECSYSTAIKGELPRHIEQVHRNVCRYRCDICGRGIKGHSGLVRHKQSHFGLKPFKCSHCGQAFADRHNLKVHIDRHLKMNDVPTAIGIDESDIADFSVPRSSETEVVAAVGSAAKSPVVNSSDASMLDIDVTASELADLEEVKSLSEDAIDVET